MALKVKETPAQLNTDIRKFISEKNEKGETYSAADIAYIQKYVGDGGLANKGVSSRGVLYEYYTPYSIIKKMWALAYKHGFKSGSILEPSCGVGRFLKFVNPAINTVDAYEFAKDNDTSFQIAKASYPWANISCDYFESIFYKDNTRVGTSKRYDLVIGNPPYGAFTGMYSGKKREGKYTNARTYDQYFIWAGIELLKPGGLLVYIIPSAFLDNMSSYNAFKQMIDMKAELVDAYRLPQGAFDATDVQTDIVVFKKR